MTTFTKIKSDDAIIYSTEIHSIKVEFEVEVSESYWNLGFTVAEDYYKTDLPKSSKLAITRWLLGVWEDLKLENDDFSCQPTIENDEAKDSDIKCGFEPSWRAKLYSKLGFVPLTDNNGNVDYCYMVYGRKPTQEELTSYFG